MAPDYIAPPRKTRDTYTRAEVYEILEALRELHDFADLSSHDDCAKRSEEAFERAADILNQYNA